MSIRPRMYIAGKYSAATEAEKLANTERAMTVGIHLWRKGYAPFIPHLSHFTDLLATRLELPISYREWVEWDDVYQEICEAFFYDSSSVGADRELENAQRIGQPVFRHLEDVPPARELIHGMRKPALIVRLPHSLGLPLPEYQTSGSAGLDLCAATPEGEEIVLPRGETLMVPTGYAVAIPAGCAGLVLPRSGLATKYGITLANSPGLVDSDFRGELMIALRNTGGEHFYFKRGARLAQFVLVDVNRAVWSVVDTLPETKRGQGGFGSTGLA